uniref:Uncharacterized protein n=1 Tax=Neobodo designis TaxID=312471 RepID=A0A7S1QT17_NEODS
MGDADAWLVSPARNVPRPPPCQKAMSERAEELLATGKWARAVDPETGADFFFDVCKPQLRTWNLAGWVEHQFVLHEAMSEPREAPPPVSDDSAGSEEHWRERIVHLYEQYNPSKLPVVDELLSRYAGREQELWRNLMSKYGAGDASPPPAKQTSPKPSSRDPSPASTPGRTVRQELVDTPSPQQTQTRESPRDDDERDVTGNVQVPVREPTTSPVRRSDPRSASLSPRQAAELKARALLTKSTVPTGRSDQTPLKRTTPTRSTPTARRGSPASSRRGASPTSGRRGIPTEDPAWAEDLERRTAMVAARREELAKQRREARAAREAQVAARQADQLQLQRTKSLTTPTGPTPEKVRPTTPKRVVRDRVSLVERQAEAAAALRVRNTAERPATAEFDASCPTPNAVGWKGNVPIDNNARS